MSSAAVAVRAAVADAAAIVLFTVIGRATHGETLSVGGVATTAWPFLAGAAIGWLAAVAWRAPTRPVRSGIAVWLAAVVLGMVIRVLVGQGTAVPFILVAAGFLLLTLVGWRIVVALTSRRRRHGRAS